MLANEYNLRNCRNMMFLCPCGLSIVASFKSVPPCECEKSLHGKALKTVPSSIGCGKSLHGEAMCVKPVPPCECEKSLHGEAMCVKPVPSSV